MILYIIVILELQNQQLADLWRSDGVYSCLNAAVIGDK